MKPREIRKRILEAAYEYRHDDFGIETKMLEEKLPNVDEKTLHQEISYLEQKNLVNIKGKFMGKAYLNYMAIAISAWGIDLVEDPEEFGRLFSVKIDASHNSFSNISNSAITLNSEYVSQVVKGENDDTKKLLEQLIEAADQKDKSAVLKTLGYIGDKSLDLLIAIVAGGVKL